MTGKRLCLSNKVQRMFSNLCKCITVFLIGLNLHSQRTLSTKLTRPNYISPLAVVPDDPTLQVCRWEMLFPENSLQARFIPWNITVGLDYRLC